MKPQHKVITAAVSSFIAGGLLVGIVAYVSFNRFLHQEFVASYHAQAVEAQFAVRSLSRLRSGDTDKVIHDLDLMLNANTLQLAEYENAVPTAQREAYVYELSVKCATTARSIRRTSSIPCSRPSLKRR